MKGPQSEPTKCQHWPREEMRDSCQAKLWAASTAGFHHGKEVCLQRCASNLTALTLICTALQNQSDCTNMHTCFGQNRCDGQCEIGQSVNVYSGQQLQAAVGKMREGAS